MRKLESRILFFLFGLVFIISNCFAQQYWIEQPCPTSKMLVCLFFSDSLNAWAGGDSTVIIHTSNGGQNWVVQQDGLSVFSIEDMYFPTNNTGWAISNDYLMQGTTIYRTTDSGNNWTHSNYPDTSFILKTVYFLNMQTGFLGGYNANNNQSVVVKTIDGGLLWQKCSVATGDSCHTLPILRFKFLDSLNGFACGGVIEQSGTYWTTTNGGSKWITPVKCISGEPIWDLYFIDQNRRLLTGGDFDFGGANYVMLDGVNWIFVPFNFHGVPHRIARRTENEYWIPTGNTGFFSYSTDTFETWAFWQIQDSLAMYDVHFVNDHNGWAVGCKGINCRGAIMKYNTAIIGVTENQSNVPGKLSLFQNYPNPFNPSTMIKFYLPRASDVNLSVFDLTGKLVKTLANSKMERGYYEQIFESNDLASGVYIYRITANNTVDSKKMVLMK